MDFTTYNILLLRSIKFLLSLLLYFQLYNDANATGAMIGRFPMNYWSTDVGLTPVETSFLCFVQHGRRAVLKMFVRLFRIKQEKGSRKVYGRSYLLIDLGFVHERISYVKECNLFTRLTCSTRSRRLFKHLK